MASALDMTTVATAASRLGASLSDATLPALITAASSALAAYLRYPVQRREGVVETVKAEGGQYLWLESCVVQSIASISVGGQVLDASLYGLDGRRGAILGRIVTRGSMWRWPFTGEWTGGVSSTPLRSRDTGEISVTFTCGWVTPGQVALSTFSPSDMPPELEQAALEVVAAWYSGKGRDGRVTSMSTGDASVSFGSKLPPLPAVAKLLCVPYRKPGGR